MKDHDYVSPNYTYPDLESAFPNRIIGDKNCHPWQYLRREVPHIWYVDRRDPIMGFLNSDESSILYTLAGQIPNANALEIGAHRGWSTAHIAANVQSLDIVDPAFSDEDRLSDVKHSLQLAKLNAKCRFQAGSSPEAIQELAKESNSKQWDFIFIDGDHEKDASRKDAAAILRHASPDCIVVFHDLSSPHVANGLAYMRSLGWNTIVFQTMQIMGAAWRGNVTIPQHYPDPGANWVLPDHLQTFAVSGEQLTDRCRRLDRTFAKLTSYDHEVRKNSCLLPGAAGMYGDVGMEFTDTKAENIMKNAEIQNRLDIIETRILNLETQNKQIFNAQSKIEI